MSLELEKRLAEQSLKDKYETQIKDREEQIERLRDLKAKLSTKMVGETLEQHCEIEFNRIRPMGFQRAYFEKDIPADLRSWIFVGSCHFQNEEVIRSQNTSLARQLFQITFCKGWKISKTLYVSWV